MPDLSPPVFEGEQPISFATVRELLDSIGYEAHWERREIEPPPKVCEPMMEYDQDEDPIGRVCVVHQVEWWPCEAYRAGRGFEVLPAVDTDVLVIRPRSTDGAH